MQGTQEEKQGHPAWAVRLLAAAGTLILLFALAAGPALAAGGHTVGRTVIPVGRAVGIKLFSDGVLVVGLSGVETGGGNADPAKACGLKEGDIITHINSAEVDTIEEVRSILQDLSGERMSLRVRRDGKEVQMTAQAVKCAADGSYKLGAWIRDSMAGIGTITFYDPASGVFGALGHGVSDVDTAQLMPLQSGSIMYAEVSDVRRGAAGTPGELHGTFQVERDLGELYANTSSGLFGTTDGSGLLDGQEPVPVASRAQVRTGKATILSNVTGDRVEEYEIEIVRIYPEGEGRDMTIRVTDPRLLERTGGIVQGMSGSPILQDGRLAGAVTHVLVNDPVQGYGILAEHMTAAAE